MITEGFIKIILKMFSGVFTVLPDIQIDFTSSMYTTFMEIVSGVIYLLPVNTFMHIFGIVVSLITFRILIAGLKALWSVLPFV